MGSARWSDRSLVRQSAGPTDHWSDSLLVRQCIGPTDLLNSSRMYGSSEKLRRAVQSIGPTVHWSDNPLVRQSIGPTVHWSDISTETQQDECQQRQTSKSHLQSIVPTIYCSDSPLVFCLVWSKMPHKDTKIARCSIHD